jgi:FKBP-type peptidyl-prolyl cis-trans isomerase (trigger factor)
MSIRVEIPDSIFHLPSAEISRQILETVVIEGFRAGRLTTYQVRKMLGFETRYEVHKFLADHDVPWVDYSVQDLERERETLKELLG